MDNPRTILGERRTYTDVADTHDHDYAQLIMPLHGSMEIRTDRHQLELTTSRVFFLPPGCHHTFFSRVNNHFLVLDVPSQTLPSRDLARWPGGVSLILDERWQALRALLLAEVGEQPATGAPLTHLFHYLYHRLLASPGLPPSIDYLNHHFNQPVDLATLAALEGFSLTYYCDWFKRQTSQTVGNYLQQLRLDAAKTLLAQTDLPILHIAQQVGYEQHASLVRLFQRLERTTPSAYRRQARRQ